MGIGGNFWDLLKPYARHEGVDYLRDKRVAVDLSYWIVQHDAAVRSRAPRVPNPHIRATFFRTVALFSKMGAYPVFVVDGAPSSLKSQARIERFFRMSGLGPTELPVPTKGEETMPKQRNQTFGRYVRECVELLNLLGMPVLEAHGEAEALCAQLSRDGYVDACITADSDAFLFGAKCVIKTLRSNSKEPFECYNLSDIEAGLGLKRKHMVAIALLVGNDHDIHGVAGFGVSTAYRFVKSSSEDEVLNRLFEIGKGDIHLPDSMCKSPSSSENSPNARIPHCSNCGHPGTKRAHIGTACQYCLLSSSENCTKKQPGFRCMCCSCEEGRKVKEQQKLGSWQRKLSDMISAEEGFPNNEIIELFLSNKHGNYSEKDGPLLKWDRPKVEELIDFLTYYQHWEPSYIRQRFLPMMSTIFLREKASRRNENLLLCDQYEFHSIQRVKIRYGHSYYLVKWKKAALSNALHTISDDIKYQTESDQEESEVNDSIAALDSLDALDNPDIPEVLIDDGCWFLLTDENLNLVKSAFPDEVEQFQQEKKLQETRSKQGRSMEKPTGTQLSITEFYRSTKPQARAKPGNSREKSLCTEDSPRATRKRPADADKNLPKSVRRRLLFD